MKNLQELYEWIEKLKTIKQGDKMRIGDPIYAQRAMALLVEAFYGKDRMPNNVDPEDLKNALDAACKAMGVSQEKFLSLKLQEAAILAQHSIFSKLQEELESIAAENKASFGAIDAMLRKDELFGQRSEVVAVEEIFDSAESAAKKFYIESGIGDAFGIDRFVSEKISNGPTAIRLACAYMMSSESVDAKFRSDSESSKSFFERIVDISNKSNSTKSKLAS